MPRLPFDPSDYYRNPYSGAGQPAVYMPGDDDDAPDEETDWMGPYPASGPVGSPAAASVSAAQASPVSAPRQKSQAELRDQQDYDQLRATLADAPKQVAPKWWQGVAAGLAGFGAGWSNAAGRSPHPIDIGAMQDNILHPGYKQKLQEWQSRVQPLQQVAALDRGQADQERRNRQLDIQEDWNKARANKDNALAKWWQGRPYPAGKPPAETMQDRIQRVEDLKKAGHNVDDNMANYYYLHGNLTGYGSTLANPTAAGSDLQNVPAGAAVIDKNSHKVVYTNPRSATPVDPVVEEGRQFRLEEARRKSDEGVTQAKLNAEKTVHAQRHQEVATLMSKYGAASEESLKDLPDAYAQLVGINKRYAPKLQAIQNDYADRVRKRGGTAEDYDVDPPSLAYNLRRVPANR